MAGYSLMSPVNQGYNHRKSPFNRRTSTPSSFSSNNTNKMSRISSPHMNNNKVLKTKSRLKMNTFQLIDRQKYKDILFQHLKQSKPKNNDLNKFDMTPNVNNLWYKRNSLLHYPSRPSESLVELVKSNGLTAGSVEILNPKINPIPIEPVVNNSVNVPSKLDKIREWDIPENSNAFKKEVEKKFTLIYPFSNEKICQNNKSSLQESQLNEKLNCLSLFKNERKTISSKIKSLFLPFLSYNFYSKLKSFIPYKHEDYEVCEKAQITIQDELVPFTEEMEAEIFDILNSQNKLLVTGFAMNVYTNDLMTLYGTNWLNDVVIEFYLNLIVLRSQSEKKYSSVYAFSTYFFTRLSKGNSLGRWANKLDFFAYDLLIVPIHHASHWRLAVIDNQKKSIEYYDSLGNEFRQCVDLLANFLENESLNKRKTKLDLSEWKLIYKIPDIPKQENFYDCGVFTCKYADYISRRSPLNFSQEHIPYFRKCMMYEIVHKKLLV